MRLVVNPGSGPVWTANPADRLRRELPAAEIHELEEGDDLTEILATTPGDGIVAIGAAGGDGTLSTALSWPTPPASCSWRSPPARSTTWPATSASTTRQTPSPRSAAGTVTRMDLGRDNELDGALVRTFVNTLSFGGYTEVVDAREALQPKLGKWLALVVALARQLPRMEPLDLEIDGRRTLVWLGWIGNGTYAPEGFAPSWRERLDDGILDVRLVLGGSAGRAPASCSRCSPVACCAARSTARSVSGPSRSMPAVDHCASPSTVRRSTTGVASRSPSWTGRWPSPCRPTDGTTVATTFPASGPDQVAWMKSYDSQTRWFMIDWTSVRYVTASAVYQRPVNHRPTQPHRSPAA